MLHVKMQKKHHVISSLNKCLTENVLNWYPSCFATAKWCQTSSIAKSGTTFRRSSWVALTRCALHGALSCMNTKSPDLNHWESNKTKTGRDWWQNNIEGYVYFQWKRRLAAVAKQDGDQLSTASDKLVLMLLTIDFVVFLHSSSSSFISDTGSIEITIKQHRGQTGNIQKYTQNDRSNAQTERDKDRNKKQRIKNNCT